MKGKKWDVYVYGDVNIDLVVPGVSSLPKPGQEDEVPVMDTYVGGGAALFALGIGKLGLHPVFQGEVGDDCYGELIRKEFAAKNIDDSLLGTSRTEKTGISISFTNEKDRSFLTYRGTNAGISIDKVDIEGVKNASHIHMTGYEGSKNHAAYLSLLKRVKAETEATGLVRSGLGFNRGMESSDQGAVSVYRRAVHERDGSDSLWQDEDRTGSGTRVCEGLRQGGHQAWQQRFSCNRKRKRGLSPGVPGKGCGYDWRRGFV